MNEQTDAARFEALVRAAMAEGASLPGAVRTVRIRHRALALAAMETIGSWPSSEPILFELQRQW